MKRNFTRSDSVPSCKTHGHFRSLLPDLLKIFILIISLVGTGLTANAKTVIKTFEPGHITGTVVDSATGRPLMGVTIQVKGNTIGTMTNANGHFDLEVPENATLIVSYLGYRTKEILVKGSATLNILLSASNAALNEVVVTALGIKRQEMQLGYAVQEVKGSTLTKAVEPNVMSSLTGKVAGLTVYNSSSLYENPVFTIRGATPLVVIDGVPSLSNFWNISPDDIESIDVLKGATATALYGSQGLNGAIIINTKKGAEGANGVQFSFNSSTQFKAGFLNFPKTQTQYGMGYGGDYEFVDGKGGGINDGSGYVWGPPLNVKDPNTKSGFVERTQYNSLVGPDGKLVPLPWITRGANNLKNFLREGYLTINNFNVTGKNDMGNYRISLTHEYQHGQVPNTGLQSVTFSMAGEYRLLNKLNAEATLSYNKNFSPNWNPTDYGPGNFIYNILLWMGPDVDIRDLRNYWQPGKQGIQQFNYNYAWYNNPWFVAYQNLNGYYRDAPTGTLKLTYDIAKGLSLMVRSGANINITNTTQETPLSLINYTSTTDGAYSQSSESTFQIISDFLLSYKKQISKDFGFDVSGGGSNRYYKDNYLSASASGLNVPGVYNLGNSKRPVAANNSLSEEKVNSLYGFVNLSYKDAIFLSLTGRNDWSSALPINHDSYFYPSASLSVVLSNMIRMPDYVSFLKLRGSWSNISSDFRPYSAFGTYSYGTIYNQTSPSLYMGGTLYNQNLQPSKTINREAGFNIRFLNNRIGADFAYYNILDLNQIISLPISQASGYTSKLINANKFNRRGIEVALNGTPIKTKDWEWDLLANYSRDRKYLVSLYGTQTNLNGVYRGQRMDLYRGWVWEKSPKGEIIYQNGLPVYDPSGIKPLGYTTPNWVWGLNSQLRYKQFQLVLGFDGRVGGVMFNGLEDKLWEGGMDIRSANKYRAADYAGAATYVGKGVVVTGGQLVTDANGKVISDTRTFAPNTTAVNYHDWVGAYYANGVNESEMYNKTFMKLRSVTVTYNLPQRILHKTFLTEASVSLVGTNIFLKTKVPYVDPDPITPDYYSYQLEEPTTRNIGINLNLKF